MFIQKRRDIYNTAGENEFIIDATIGEKYIIIRTCQDIDIDRQVTRCYLVSDDGILRWSCIKEANVNTYTQLIKVVGNMIWFSETDKAESSTTLI